ncbi:MAG: FAD:protein FMN transferase [Shewanella sp.]
MTSASVSRALPYQLHPREWGYLGQFRAMASPCEVLIGADDPAIAQEMLALTVAQVQRIEQKYSRFIPHNYLWQLNHGEGQGQAIDSETWQLLAFAQRCFELSAGLFDITAGPLMQLWQFTGQSRIPAEADILKAKALVGFARLSLTPEALRMPQGMQLDLGGIAKEYAVDKLAYELAARYPHIPVLVNFGGDIACPIHKTPPWQVGIEDPKRLDHAAKVLAISQGALATSGDTRRFIEVNGQRYGHIIDPRTGYPVLGAPRSVTVLGPNCVTAGMLATMAMLEGPNAEQFLQQQAVKHDIFR